MIKYPASYARMRGIKGKLLEKAQLESFLGAPDARTITSALTRTLYGEQVQESFDIPQVEHNLKQGLVVSYMRILQFLRGSSADFIKSLLGRFELLNVKSIIRAIVRKSEKSISIDPFIFSLGKYHTIPIKDALKANDLKGFISIMERTPFARSLEIGYQEYETEGTIFPIELALDLNYYERVRESLNALGPIDKIMAGKLVGMQYDIYNILWIFRFKEYYKFPPEKIIQYIIPYEWAMSRNDLQGIISENDVLSAIKELHISPYSKVLDSVLPVDGSLMAGAEIALWRYLHRECISSFANFPLQIGLLVAFLIVAEMQVKDIVTILSGRNLGLSPERIRQYLITL